MSDFLDELEKELNTDTINKMSEITVKKNEMEEIKRICSDLERESARIKEVQKKVREKEALEKIKRKRNDERR